MKTTERIIIALATLIVVLAFLAAVTGVLTQTSGGAVDFTTERGQVVPLQGKGLYRYDSVSTAAQAVAQDVVTLVVGIPLLIVSLGLFARGSLRGKVLLAGTLGYFLYTYTSLATLAAYNEFFLIYVALFSMSLFAFILAVQSVYAADLPVHITTQFPRRAIAYACFFVGLMLALMWLGRIVPALTQGVTPVGLDNATTLVIQVLDLGVIVPVAILVGVLLLRRVNLAYVLASVLMIKGVTMGAATTAMVVGQMLAGVPVTLVEAIMFPLFALMFTVLTVLLLRSLSETIASQKHTLTELRISPRRGA